MVNGPLFELLPQVCKHRGGPAEKEYSSDCSGTDLEATQKYSKKY